MPNFCIARIEKVKSFNTMKVIEGHNGKRRLYSEDNVRSEDTVLNKAYKTKNFTTAKEMFEANKKLYEETHTKKMRKDTVKGLDVVGACSKTSFDKYDADARKIWEKDCLTFMQKKFKGQEFEIWFHYDETAPHFHAYVPMGKDGIFNANPFCGNGEILSKTQDIFAECVSNLGIQRGIKGSKDKHNKIQKFYAEKNEETKQQGEAQIEETKREYKELEESARQQARKAYEDVVKSLGLKVADEKDGDMTPSKIEDDIFKSL